MPFQVCASCGKQVREQDAVCWNCGNRVDGTPDADIEAEVALLPTQAGGRKAPALSGYKPHHRVLPNYLSSGEHRYIGRPELRPGETALATIKFVSPESYPHCLWVGRVLEVAEGPRVVGSARITKIFNPLLERSEGRGTGRNPGRAR